MAKLAIVFSGQGSQAIGMLSDLAQKHPIVKATFAMASNVLGYDLWDLVQNGPEAKLNQTEFTQPAVLAADYAIWCTWEQSKSILQPPSYLAGHSLGEYAALVCAKALKFEDAISLVQDRGRFMQDAVPTGKGAMLAIIGLDQEKIPAVCKAASAASNGQILVPANYNSLEQTVLAGESAAAHAAIDLAKAAGAKKVVLLPVSVPSHCELMREASQLLAKRLDNIIVNIPIIPVINNVDVCIYNDPEKIKAALVRQIFSPVRWVETIQFMVREGVDTILECGPGKVLTGLNKRIANTIKTIMN
jgi:[acyl-carrier-protein] S-malonyltransferase